jgi:hypothetical protein
MDYILWIKASKTLIELHAMQEKLKFDETYVADIEKILGLLRPVSAEVRYQFQLKLQKAKSSEDLTFIHTELQIINFQIKLNKCEELIKVIFIFDTTWDVEEKKKYLSQIQSLDALESYQSNLENTYNNLFIQCSDECNTLIDEIRAFPSYENNDFLDEVLYSDANRTKDLSKIKQFQESLIAAKKIFEQDRKNVVPPSSPLISPSTSIADMGIFKKIAPASPNNSQTFLDGLEIVSGVAFAVGFVAAVTSIALISTGTFGLVPALVLLGTLLTSVAIAVSGVVVIISNEKMPEEKPPLKIL